jgi:hypothetical protein
VGAYDQILGRVTDRFMADLLGVSVEQYQRRRTQNSPGQMSLFDDPATGSNLLRSSARQQSFDWDESKVKRDPEGKFAEKAEPKKESEFKTATDFLSEGKTHHFPTRKGRSSARSPGLKSTAGGSWPSSTTGKGNSTKLTPNGSMIFMRK